MIGYLADKGHRILANGYNVIPIKPGEKFPSIKDWRGKLTTKAMLDGWKANGRGSHGAGITTGKVVLADIDIYYPPLNDHMVAFVQTHVGFGAIRIGYPPKCGMMFRCDVPFKKITSKEYVDPQGRKAQVEILGEGQQFVAYAIHPQTFRPYYWTDPKENPEVTPASELYEITEAQARAIVAEFERKCEELGWPLKGAARTDPQPTTSTSVARVAQAETPPWADDDPFDIGRGPIDITDEELAELVKLIPNDRAPYEGEDLTFLNVLAAIHEQTGGSAVGYDIAREWCDRYTLTEEPGMFDKTWNSLGKGSGPRVTAKLLVKLAKEYRTATITDRLTAAKTKSDLEAVAETISKIEKLTNLEREEYAVAVQAAAVRILGHHIPIKLARQMVHPVAIHPDLQGFELNEDGVALAFVEKHKNDLRFCATNSKWYHWNGVYWKPENTRLAFDWARHTCRDLRADNPMAEALSKASAAEAVEKYARADRRLVVELDVFDTDPWLLGTPDGTIDLHTGELRVAQQEDYITKITKVGPGLEGRCPKWMKFLNEATNNNASFIRYLQMQCGYYLTGNTREQSLLFIFGPGGNGKGVLIHTLEYIFNDYSTTASMDTFADNQGFHRHPADIAALNGYRLVVTSEVAEGQMWDEVRIKALTGGDRISARLMRENFSNFTPNFKLMVIGNNEPALRTVDEAMKRRLQMAPFTNKPVVKNLDLESELKAEAPEILLWAINGALDWQQNGMILPNIVREETDRYFEEQDLMGQWLDEFTEKGNYETLTTVLKASFDMVTGSESNRQDRRSVMAFSASLVKRGYERVRNVTDESGERGRGFKGLRLKEVFDEL